MKGRGSKILASMAAMKHNSSNALIMVVVVAVSVQFFLVGIEFPRGAFKPDAAPTGGGGGCSVARACVRSSNLALVQFLRTEQGEIGAVVSEIQISTMANCQLFNAAS